jgi:hypothetical protein
MSLLPKLVPNYQLLSHSVEQHGDDMYDKEGMGRGGIWQGVGQRGDD